MGAAGGLKIGLLLAIESPRFKPEFACTLHLLLTLSDLRIIALCTKPPSPFVGDGGRPAPKMLEDRVSVGSVSAAPCMSEGFESLASVKELPLTGAGGAGFSVLCFCTDPTLDPRLRASGACVASSTVGELWRASGCSPEEDESSTSDDNPGNPSPF